MAWERSSASARWATARINHLAGSVNDSGTHANHLVALEQSAGREKYRNR